MTRMLLPQTSGRSHVNQSGKSWDKIAGSIVGGIIGDAAGACFEFTSGNTVTPQEIPDYVNPWKHMNVFDHPAGTFTDDSIEMILFMEMVNETNGDPTLSGYKNKLLDWIDYGYWTPEGHCFDVGGQTMLELKFGPHVPADQNQQGNGGIMRVAPIAWFFAEDDSRILKYNRLTHPAVVCNAAALLMSNIITGTQTVEEATDKIEGLISRLDGYYRPGSAWVLSTLLQALYMIEKHGPRFELGLSEIINHGGDTDTIACVYGQIWGSIYGVSEIDPVLYQSIWRIQAVVDLITEFTKHV